jgi:outer membrane immunogenic protein
MKALCALALAAACVPGIAAAQDQDAGTRANNFDGVRAEARVGWETPTVSDDGDVYKIDSNVSGGGEVGFDFALGKSVVAGPYAVYEFSSVKLCDSGVCIKEKGNLGIGARIGFAVGDNVLLYAKAGYTRIAMDLTVGSSVLPLDKDGVQGALGANLNFGKNVYGLLEFNYGDYGKLDKYGLSGIGLQRRHVAAGVGVRF